MRRPAAILWAVLLAGCGSDPGKAPVLGPEDVDSSDVATAPKRNSSGGGPTIEAEVGALDAEAVDLAFNNARPKVGDCFADANQAMDMAVVGGEIEVLVRVKSDGSLRHIYPVKSDVGHRGVEQCVIDALRAESWPKPEGGEEGIARTRYRLGPPGRAPVAWSSSDLGDKARALQSKLKSCNSGSATLTVTMYVDADGQPMAAGASVSDETGINAISCAVSAAKALKYASPGSYPAKVSVSVN